MVPNGDQYHGSASMDEKLQIGHWTPNKYDTNDDWVKELERLGASSSWRVTEVNTGFEVSPK